ncbi:MAG: hypothetical protein NTV49_12260 [Kiritimatiellaeota bacterium]|nr:hypothetical protein [Kiritimatiellota bacterium]
MMRLLLFALAVLEMAVGLLGLIGAIRLYFSHDAGMVMIYWPVLVTAAFFLVTGAAIFLRRVWSYYLHVGVILLIGALDVLYLGLIFGRNSGRLLALVAITVVPLTVIFLLPSVRGWFDMRGKTNECI